MSGGSGGRQARQPRGAGPWDLVRTGDGSSRQAADRPPGSSACRRHGRAGTGRRAPPHSRASAPFPSWHRSTLTEIHLCHACSYHEIEDDGDGAPGRHDQRGGRLDRTRARGTTQAAGCRLPQRLLAWATRGRGPGRRDTGAGVTQWEAAVHNVGPRPPPACNTPACTCCLDFTLVGFTSMSCGTLTLAVHSYIIYNIYYNNIFIVYTKCEGAARHPCLNSFHRMLMQV
jgi:hypothetical protein